MIGAEYDTLTIKGEKGGKKKTDMTQTGSACMIGVGFDTLATRGKEGGEKKA